MGEGRALAGAPRYIGSVPAAGPRRSEIYDSGYDRVAVERILDQLHAGQGPGRLGQPRAIHSQRSDRALASRIDVSSRLHGFAPRPAQDLWSRGWASDSRIVRVVCISGCSRTSLEGTVAANVGLHLLS